jgi:uroporphyrinogen III methyltransferase / synthase
MSDDSGATEGKPLAGKSVLVTRRRAQAADLVSLLEAAGAQIVEFPTIEILPPLSYDSLDAVIDHLERFAWLIFTSTNGVESFFERLRSKGLDATAVAKTRVAAVGRATAAALTRCGLTADVVPAKFQSTAIAPLLGDDVRGLGIAIIRAEKGRDELIDDLRGRGAVVDLAVAYRTIGVESLPEELRQSIRRGEIDAVTFTSPSTVENLLALLGAEERAALGCAVLASIGPVTSKAMRESGLPPTVEATEASVEALARAVVEALSARPRGKRS